MIVYRIAKSDFIDDLSGNGARLYGGRWNSKGTAALYTSVFRSLSAVEMAVHINGILNQFTFELLTLDTQKIPLVNLSKKLPVGWNQNPVAFQSQHLGDRYLNDPNCGGIIVPSVLIEEEMNVILNPAYVQYQQLKITGKCKFAFDGRLISK